MNSIRIKYVLVLALMVTITALTQASIPAAPERDPSTPDLPSPLCDSLQPPAGSHLVLRAYAVGAQVYRWNGSSWTFVEPVATLYNDAAYQEKIGTHYLGPTWENNNGSKVVATKLVGCTPDATAVPWLLLQKVTNDGPSPFGNVTHIQRVNTKGGIAPTAPGSSIGAVAEVPYTAEYYFYRE
jgi:uncharacterized protein DUF3455